MFSWKARDLGVSVGSRSCPLVTDELSFHRGVSPSRAEPGLTLAAETEGPPPGSSLCASAVPSCHCTCFVCSCVAMVNVSPFLIRRSASSVLGRPRFLSSGPGVLRPCGFHLQTLPPGLARAHRAGLSLAAALSSCSPSTRRRRCPGSLMSLYLLLLPGALVPLRRKAWDVVETCFLTSGCHSSRTPQ